MPVTNAHLDEELPWTKPGMTGMKIKPTGRPCGTLANLAGMAENVGGLTEEERAARGGPDRLLEWSDTPPHVAVTDESHAKPSASPAFRSLEKFIGAGVRVGGLLRRRG